LWTAIAGSGFAPCPGCGAKIEGLSTGSNDGVLCTGCKKFCLGKEGGLRMTEESGVADSPLFGAVLPESFDWPRGCGVCARPETQREAVSVSLPSAPAAAKGLAVTALTGGVLTQTGGGTRYAVQIPQCGATGTGRRWALFLEAGSGSGSTRTFLSGRSASST
jgi:hypothetical protein